MTLLFGWFYLAWLGIKWAVQIAWAFTVWAWNALLAAGRWTERSIRAAWPHVMRGIQAFHERFGAKGWAVLAATVVVLSMLGILIGNTGH
jgi:hypothetical protein